MGLLDVLRGQRAPKRADLDRIFGIGSAAVTLEVSLGLATTGRAGVCFRAIDAEVFAQLVREIEELLAATSSDSGTTVSRHDDSFGFSWVVIADPDMDDLATTTHVVSQSLEERGFSEQLLCAVFGFDGEPGPLDLVYNYKRGSFYPFAPRGDNRRDAILERRVQSLLTSELSLEPELERWYPVWDAPVATP
ncbi:MAG: hypothetical protein JHC74_10785 [Thermoleophilia bacterium]|nr:hypothetical protein [Thermoleophilia bacterium]